MVYLLIFPRPVGVDPTIYLTKPNLSELDENDPMVPSVEEFESEFLARLYIFKNLGKVEVSVVN